MRTLVLLLIGMHLIGQVFCQVCHDTNFDGDDDDGNDDNGNTVDDCDEAPNRKLKNKPLMSENWNLPRIK